MSWASDRFGHTAPSLTACFWFRLCLTVSPFSPAPPRLSFLFFCFSFHFPSINIVLWLRTSCLSWTKKYLRHLGDFLIRHADLPVALTHSCWTNKQTNTQTVWHIRGYIRLNNGKWSNKKKSLSLFLGNIVWVCRLSWTWLDGSVVDTYPGDTHFPPHTHGRSQSAPPVGSVTSGVLLFLLTPGLFGGAFNSLT